DGEVAGVEDSERPLDGAERAGDLQALARPPAEMVERGELDGPRGPAARRRLAGDADETDAVLLRQARDDVEDPRQHVEVLVRVGVHHRQTGGEQPFDLQPQLGFHLGQGETAEGEPPRQGRIAGEQGAVSAGGGSAAFSGVGCSCRRRGWRISGYRWTSSRRILKITDGEERVDSPRLRGK